MLYRVNGIVIRSFDYGEGNKIITILTNEYGKMSVMVRGAKKVKSRYSAITQLFTYGEFVFFKSGSMGNLSAGEIIKPYNKLREDIHKAAYGSYLAELTEKLLGEQDRAGWVFDQLLAAFDAMEADKDLQIVTHIYEMRLLALAGYEPDMSQCVSCGAESKEMSLSAAMGGALCPRCRHLDPQAIPLAESVVRLIRLFQRMDIARLGQIDLADSTRSLLKTAIRRLYDTHIDVKWKSRQFLDQMEKYGI
ncbi:DNA repair protein RecO [Paenibacillus koleovorans]|uniref:DNA repair protein RecO n=1 Tax=Paenibacillus koleovorans TaxID=121608 RepID=UPI000FDC9651|nr:DNA repair protein RecO [Paenibacillus koleovorans]